MNNKRRGEIGERISIGELAKFGIDIAIPLTDNLPFDYILIYNHKLFKVQVKSATPKETFCEFDLTSNNWYKGTKRKYTREDTDFILLCDFQHVFILTPKDFEGKGSFRIRYKTDKLNQKTQNSFKDYILTKARIEKLFS